jgi:transglutaminase-like putative cysteine protease
VIKALACFTYLRSLPFGCIADSATTSGLAVLRFGKGDCHSKSTLLVALLRSLAHPFAHALCDAQARLSAWHY